MSKPVTSNGDCIGSSNDKTENNTHSTDTNGSSASSSASSTCRTGSSGSSMKVQDFMSYLAEEANITNMTVETNDGRRISATFKNGLPISTSTAQIGSPASNVDLPAAPGSHRKTVAGPKKDNASGETSQESSKADGETGKAAMMSPTRDIATTIAMLGAGKTASTPPTLPKPGFDACTSPEWAKNYQNKHVTVTYASIVKGTVPSLTNGNGKKRKGSCVSGSGTTTSLPPKKRAAVKTEEGSSESSWNAMSALVDAATVAQREHEQVPPGAAGFGGSASAKAATALAMGMNIPATSLKKKPTKRKPRKIIPEIKTYVEFTPIDVLFGRGGRSNHHPGNKIYREIVTKQQNHYRGCDKNEKTKVAQGIVDHIQNTVGGRFLELDRDIKRWFLVPNVVARRKVGQALRENNTEEARAAKRAKYQGRLNSKKKHLVTVESVMNGNGIMPMIAVNNGNSTGTSSNVGFPIGASSTEVATNPFPIEDAESSNRVAV